MSKLHARIENGKIRAFMDAPGGFFFADLTIEESRALRGEMEKAEEEAGRKSAYQKWACSPSDTPGDLCEAWNAAIDAAIALEVTVGGVERLRALKEPVE